MLFVLLTNAFITTAQTPNFIIILADDQGWTGTSVQMDQNDASSKSDYYYTPNLEAMATAGLTFSQAYSSAAKCSPSRNSILTGKSTARSQFTTTDNQIASGEKIIEPNSITSINSSDTTIVEWLQNTGLNYRTAHYGKWHLSNGGPSSHGFDYGSGDTDNNDGSADDGLTAQSDPKKMFEITDSAMNFMTSAVNDGKPFFLQISHYAVHTSIEAMQDKIDEVGQRATGSNHDDANYGAMTENLDSTLGLIMAKVASLGITGTTYIIYTSDNGASHTTSTNKPLTKGKKYIFEGGIRVPFIINGPNVTANTRSDEPIIGYDLLPTIASLSGSSNDLPYYIDGENISSIWNGGSFSRTNGLYFHIPHYETSGDKEPRSAIRDGDYKLIVEYASGTNYLYNLSTDNGEDTDIASSNTALVSTMRKELRDHFEKVATNMPTLNESHADFSGSGTDVDNDGLDDSWEFLKTLTYTYSPSDNVDGDIATFQEEYDYDSDPLTDEGLSATAATFRTSTDSLLESSGSTTVTIALPKSNSSGSDYTVGYTISGTATSGSDYSVLSGTVTISNGSNKADISITLIDDADDESTETLILTLDLATSSGITLGTTTTYTLTISDNECTNAALDNSLKTCTTDPDTDTYTTSYTETTYSGSDIRSITSNNIPNHTYRVPTISESTSTFLIDLTPTNTGTPTYVLGDNSVDYNLGTALNGILMKPSTAEAFVNTSTGEDNWNWVEDFAGSPGDFSADCNYAHLKSGGVYHYHGDMKEYANVLLAGLGDGTTTPTYPIQIGWAADGFPIYYKYGYVTPTDSTSGIKEYTPNYAVKSGTRSGDGVNAPCGTYNGKYTQDHEYNAGLGGDLDECNGITGVTREFPSGTYYYVVTSAYPMLPRCFMGTASSSYGYNGNGESLVLPVELTKFDGKLQGNEVLLEWTTLTENNNKGFQILKSTNGRDWQALDFIEGAGYSTEPLTYNYIDKDLKYGEVYYRLEQIDFDGASEMSQTIVLEIAYPSNTLKLYPNPNTGHLNYELSEYQTIETISVFNAIGQTILQENHINGNLNISNLPNGIYFIMVELENGQVLKEKVIKQ